MNGVSPPHPALNNCHIFWCSFNPTDALKRLELQEDIRKQQQAASPPTLVVGSQAKNVVTGSGSPLHHRRHPPIDA